LRAGYYLHIDKEHRSRGLSRLLSKTMKKALREKQTLRAGCSKAAPKIFAPPQTPFPWA